MLRLGLLFTLVLSQIAPVQAQSCPYAQYNRTFTSDAAYCKTSGAILCIVDSKCNLVPGSVIGSNSVKKDTTQTDVLVIESQADYLASLPLVSNVYTQFFGNGLKAVGDLSASTLSILDFENNTRISYANAVFPKSMTRISIARNGLKELPTTIPYGQLSEFYGWANNFTKIENIDFRRAIEVKFSDIPSLTTLSNVSFSSKLTKLFLKESKFTTFLIDDATYKVLQEVPTLQIGGINVDASCTAPNTKKQLKEFTVCVMPGASLPSDNSSGGSTETKSNTGAIIGGIIGGLVVIGAIAFFVIRRKRQDASKMDPSTNNFTYQQYTTGTQDPSMGGVANLLNLQDLLMIRLDETALVKNKPVAKGAYGEVWFGEYKGEPVAIKCLLPGKNAKGDVQFLIEEILLTSKLECQYIVKTLGASWVTPSMLEMVVEWMDRGDLKNVLEDTKPAKEFTNSTTFSWKEKIECLLAIVEGLSYLHSMDIIHRDLKSRNILMDSVKGTKLTDFGTAREATNETMTIGVGTYRWMAPEVLKENYYTVAADMYSLGMVISELTTHHIPYVDMTNAKGKALVDTAIMSMVIHEEIKPTLWPTCPEWLREFATKCFAFNPDDRPTSFQASALIRQRLKNGDFN